MTWLSHQDGEHTGRTSRELAEHLRFLNNDINRLNSQLRKTAHVVVFAVFTVLLGVTVQSGLTMQKWSILQSSEMPIWFLAIVIFWAWLDEATKPLIHGRHFSWFDVGLNLMGVVIGISLLAVGAWIS